MAHIKAVPDGYHTVTAFLSVEGARDAIAFYKQAFGAEERAIMPTPDGKVMHSEIKIGDSIVMLSDAVMLPATRSALHLYVQDVDAVYERALQAGASILAEPADKPYQERSAGVKDSFGNTWWISTYQGPS